MAIDPHIGGLYTSSHKDKIPNASGVLTVAKNSHGVWNIVGSCLCLFKNPIVIIDSWSKTWGYQRGRYYIALYEDKTIAIPAKWIKQKIYERVENG
jgi:hypothetical protein